MSYQVLARKWRPRNFREMVGQTHVLQALVNALDNDRLHHAYLFTGTRGVGKTTIARILAKSLNCETGVGSTPCGECSACREIDEGRFVDLIEVDAASRTKVDETRDLLDNVQYTPSRGRYKVYLIDEVHMFSNHSFNALLKTLEEPPPHVKFLLATTDPQKLPATILSRCLQFNLKRMDAPMIAGHLQHILKEETIDAETSALQLLARAADGSMRDGLSLLDQAIAYGGGALKESEVRAMLGTIEQRHIEDLLDLLAAGDGAGLLARVEQLAQQGPDYAGVLAEMLTLLQRVATVQVIPDVADSALADGETIKRLGAAMSPEDVQLYYQIALQGRRDLSLAPDPRSGFEMILLRMLAFRPGAGGTARADNRAAPAPQASRGRPASSAQPSPAPQAAPPSSSEDSPPPQGMPSPAAPVPTDEWGRIVADLSLKGMAQQLAANCLFSGKEGRSVNLTLDPAHAQLRSPGTEKRLQAALAAYYNEDVKLVINAAAARELPQETPAQRQARGEQERQQAAVDAISGDDNVRAMQETFDARVLPESIQPLD